MQDPGPQPEVGGVPADRGRDILKLVRRGGRDLFAHIRQFHDGFETAGDAAKLAAAGTAAPSPLRSSVVGLSGAAGPCLQSPDRFLPAHHR